MVIYDCSDTFYFPDGSGRGWSLMFGLLVSISRHPRLVLQQSLLPIGLPLTRSVRLFRCCPVNRHCCVNRYCRINGHCCVNRYCRINGYCWVNRYCRINRQCCVNHYCQINGHCCVNGYCRINCYCCVNRYCRINGHCCVCLLYTSPSPRDCIVSRMPSSA